MYFPGTIKLLTLCPQETFAVAKRNEESLVVINAMFAKVYSFMHILSNAKALCSANDSES
jgi:hypothetical protein